MKKMPAMEYSVVVILALGFMGSSMPPQQARWHTVALTRSETKTYSAHYQMGRCDVRLYLEGKGVETEATEAKQDGTILTQRVIITTMHELDGYRSPVMSHQFFFTGRKQSLPSGEKYHDVFYSRCFPNLRLLPKEAQKSFLDFYEIGEPGGSH